MRGKMLVLAVAAASLLAFAPNAIASGEEWDKYAIESASVSLSNTQAGAHADFTTQFSLTRQDGVTYGNTRDVVVRLPPGLFGNPEALPKCTTEQFGHSPEQNKCPLDSQVGSTEIVVGGVVNITANEPIYNMPAPGGDIITRFGFYALLYPVFVNVRLDPTTQTLVASAEGLSAGARLLSTSFTLWGVPGDPIHDPLRWTPREVETGQGPAGGRSSNQGDVPFMTNPTGCESGRQATFTARSYQVPDSPSTVTVPFPQITGCGVLGFNPGVSLAPTTAQASTGTGLDNVLTFPTDGLQFQNLTFDSEIKRAEVVLPQGMTINPSEAEGLGVRSEADLARETYDSPPNAGCPETSKIGTVLSETPVLDRNAEGALYLAKPYENRFGSLLALYVVLKVPDRGVLVKLAGKIEPDPLTGQLITTFDDVPQLPVSSFKLHFREGARAPLITPRACGSYQTVFNMTPWSTPTSHLIKTSAFSIESGPDHGPCPPVFPPFEPGFSAYPVNPAAGAFSPFFMEMTRKDGDQDLTKFNITMPEGLAGVLTGLAQCPDAAIAQARAHTGQNGGREEQAGPSCPASSEIGRVYAGAGVGQLLTYVQGHLYFAGPYHGAPFSVVAIVPAVAGPFDLGTVVTRQALRVDPSTGVVTVDGSSSDPIPHILDGIPLSVRDIRVEINRPHFMFNPTSCKPTSVQATIWGGGSNVFSSLDDEPHGLSQRFEVADCASLGFKPRFEASTTGKTSRRNGASLSVKLTYPKTSLGTQANIRMVRVELPKQLPSRLSTLQKACADTVFDQDPAACPAESRVGYAKAITPILPVPLEGPAYFVSHGGAKWPELIVVLQGYGVTIDLHGETFISKGITSSTFKTVPDQPVGSFELTLPQGPGSALASPDNLCHITKTVLVKHKSRRHKTRKVRKTVPGILSMPTTFTAQNGTVIHQNTEIKVAGCLNGKAKHKTKRHKHRANAKVGS